VTNRELVPCAFLGRGRKARVLVHIVVQLPRIGRVAALGHEDRFIQQSQGPRRLASFNQVEAFLIVWELDFFPRDAFRSVFFLLSLEYELIEMLLQCFVRVVDAQLLKRVMLEALEAKYVKNAAKRVLALVALNAIVDESHNPFLFRTF